MLFRSEGHVHDALIQAGFDAAYDKKSYDVAEGIYEKGKWANDFDAQNFDGPRFHQSLRFTENHDEVRLACPKVWGGHGMEVGKAATAVLFGMGRGPIMIYSGQELGEAGGDQAGFSTDETRTTIFDYWCTRELPKWVNGGRYDGGGLSDAQLRLRSWYGKLLNVMSYFAFTDGEFYGLNHTNADNENFGRLEGETVSGHWIYAYLRHDSTSGQSFLVVANFHPELALADICVRIPEHAWNFMGRQDDPVWAFEDRLEGSWHHSIGRDRLSSDGLNVGGLEAMGVAILAIHKW